MSTHAALSSLLTRWRAGQRLEVHTNDEAELIELLIGAFVGDVLVFVVGVEFEMLAHGKQAAGIERGGGPFFVLALIEDLSADVGRRMVRLDREPAFWRCDSAT